MNETTGSNGPAAGRARTGEDGPESYIAVDPTIGVFLRPEGMNVVDFLDRKRAEIEGLMAGAGALIELDRLAAGWDDLTEAAGGADAALRALGPIRGSDQEVAREMLVSARLALQDLHTAAIAVASRPASGPGKQEE